MTNLRTNMSLLFDKLIIEDDILIKIFMFLDALSLKNVESTSNDFKHFIKRTSCWQKLYQTNHTSVFDNNVSKDIGLRNKSTMNWEPHFKFKKLCLRLFYLKLNWKEKTWESRKLNIAKTFPNSTLKSLSCDRALFLQNNRFCSSLVEFMTLKNGPVAC